MAIVTEQAAGTNLGPLELLSLEHADGTRKSWEPGRVQRRLLATFGEIPACEIPEILLRLFYGPLAPGENITARFGGARPVVLRRDEKGRTTLSVGGQAVDSGTRSPGEIVFGVAREAFRDELIFDARELRPGRGSEALRDALRAQLGLPLLERSGGARQAEDLEALRRRRRLLERELDAMPRDAEVATDPVDPPAIGDLLESLEAAREVDRRILTRRLELARALEQASKRPVAELVPPNTVVLEQLETLADDLDQERRALGTLKGTEVQTTPFWARAGTGLLVLVALLSALAGKALAEPILVDLGLGLAGLAVVAIGLIWFGRVRGILQTTRRARRIRAGRQQLRERARELLARIGAIADADEISPESLRELIDRVSRRDFGRILKDLIQPFIDSPGELGVVKKLVRALETPIARAAEVTDARTPAVPLVRVTRAALALAGDWSAALAETSKRIASDVEKRVRLQIEREMLEESIEKLKNTERTLELAAGHGRAKPDPIVENAARRLETRLLPLLRRQLGARAPRSFKSDLTPCFDFEPTAATNAFILLMATLMDLREPGFRREALGRFLIDATLPLDADLEIAFARAVAELPQAGTLNLAFSRPEFAASFRRSASPLIPALISDAEAGVKAETELYSGHDRPGKPAAGPAHLLL